MEPDYTWSPEMPEEEFMPVPICGNCNQRVELAPPVPHTVVCSLSGDVLNRYTPGCSCHCLEGAIRTTAETRRRHRAAG